MLNLRILTCCFVLWIQSIGCSAGSMLRTSSSICVRPALGASPSSCKTGDFVRCKRTWVGGDICVEAGEFDT